jgi:SAM-dependent methyltransferase
MKLNLGCGKKTLDGYVNVDHLDIDGIDLLCDLSQLPLPFESNSIDEIYCCHFISHVPDIVGLMNEFHRILKQGGIVQIYAPHFSSDNYKTDPTHMNSLGMRSMNYFCKVKNWDLIYTDKLFNLELAYVSFYQFDLRKKWYNLFYWLGLEFFVNSFPRLYEKLLSNFVPANEIYFKLRK